MTAQNRTVLKSYFQRGLRPTQSNYSDLIDSFPLITGDTMTGTLILNASPTAASTSLQAATKGYVDSNASLPGGSNTQIQYNNNGAFGGFTVSGDAASLATTGVLTLANTAVSAGTYIAPQLTIDSKGRITSATPAYSEGTYTVSVTCGTSGSITLSASVNTGSYERIGNTVHVRGRVTVQSVSSPTGTLLISLPFSVANLSQLSGASCAFVALDGTVSANAGLLTAAIEDGGTTITAYIPSATALTGSPSAQVQASTNIYFSATYRAV